MINLDVTMMDDVGELFDKITVLTLVDAVDTLESIINRIEQKEEDGEILQAYEERDYHEAVHVLEAIRVVIDYFGG